MVARSAGSDGQSGVLCEAPRQIVHVLAVQAGHLAVCVKVVIEAGGIQMLQAAFEQYIRSEAGMNHSLVRRWNLVWRVGGMWGRMEVLGIGFRQHFAGQAVSESSAVLEVVS